MDNQHRKITGYRDLSAEDIELMNEVKALGVQMEAVLTKVSGYTEKQRFNMSNETRMDNATPERFIALAKTEFQTGLMYATRAVAQPEFF